jgi:putative tryptophan/tyrosine transport system substrate-binding protein
MRRREFITLLGGMAAWPIAARAQTAKQFKRVGALFGSSDNDRELAPVAAFRDGLAKLGWIEGRNLQIDARFAEGDAGRLSAYAHELVQVAPDVIFAGGNIAARAVQQQTQTIPIVFVGAGAVVGSLTVRNITHPEGNTTGFANKDVSIEGKWLELHKQVAPLTARVAFIFADSQNPSVSERERETIETAARVLGVKVMRTPFHEAARLEGAIEAFALEPNGGLVITSNVINNRELILRLAARHRLPLISAFKSYTAEGGLMSYGTDFATLHQSAATYVDRILRGAKPGDLPVQLPTKYDLVINLKTAKALGLTVPPTLLATADEVIE